MPLKFSKGPDAGVDTVVRGLTQMAHATGKGLLIPRGKPREVGPPIELFSVAMSALLKETPISHVASTGWQYLVIENGSTSQIVELHQDTSGGKPHFASSFDGRAKDSTLAAIAFAESLKELDGEDFILRMLRIPALYSEFIWLSGEAAASDRFIVASAPATGLESERAYTASDVFTRLRPFAKKRSMWTDDSDHEGESN